MWWLVPRPAHWKSGVEPNETDKRYTVPTVYIPSEQRYIMGSDSIALYIEETFPSPAVQLRSNRGDEVLKKMRQDVAIFQQRILAPREARILSPPSAEYFRRKVGSSGIEDTGADEEMVWSQAEKGFQQLSDLLLLDSGPFIEGAQPSYADFTLAGALQTIRVIDSAVLERIMRYQGQRRVYQACERWMARNT